MTAADSPQRSVLAAHEVRDGVLCVNGVPLPRLARRVGGTPFYAYSRKLVADRVADVRRRLPAELRLKYSLKANPMPALAHHLAGLVDGFDVSSGREMRVALDTGLSPDCVSFSGPGKSTDELRQAIAAGVVIHAESETELGAIRECALQTGDRPRVAVRVNPGVEVRGAGVRMGGAAQFGLSPDQARAARRRATAEGSAPLGVHVFAASQVLGTVALLQMHRQMAETVLSLADDQPGDERYVCLGGGFGIPYFAQDTSLDLAAVGDGLRSLLHERLLPRLSRATFYLELGRYLVGEAGVYVTRVVDRKEADGRHILITDGGLHHHLAATGHLGQVIQRNYPVAPGTRMGQPVEEEVDVFGRLCTPLDRLASRVRLPRCEVGDLLVIFQSGAYGLTASPTLFLGHPPPTEVLV